MLVKLGTLISIMYVERGHANLPLEFSFHDFIFVLLLLAIIIILKFARQKAVNVDLQLESMEYF